MTREYTVKFIFGNGTWFMCHVDCEYFDSVKEVATEIMNEHFGKYNYENEINKRGGIAKVEIRKGDYHD